MSTTGTGTRPSYLPHGEAVNEDGSLKEAWEISWVDDPDDEDIGTAAIFSARHSGTPKATEEGSSRNMKTKRPNKRTRKTPAPVGVFLDIEAAVSGSCDESEEVTDDEFINDIHDGNNDLGMDMRLLTATEVDSGFIENLRTKYAGRMSDRNDDLTPGTQEDSPQELGAVSPTWEVPVTMGLEIDALFHIFRRSEEGLRGSYDAPRSSFFKPNMPGRIFIEVLSRASAIHICTGIPGVHTSHTKRVGHASAVFYLESEQVTDKIERGHWVRLTRSPYKHDLALVTSANPQQSTVDVLTIPRVYYTMKMGKRKRGTRPPQALFDPVKCGQPISTVVTAGGYQFEDQIFDRAGYAILKDLPFGLYRPVLHASRTEYILFSDCTALSSVELRSAMKLLANRTLKRFDKVRVLDGQFEGWLCGVASAVCHVDI
ncbi:hypothetical protein AGABI1DRAFT_129997 [Agaricus bisporus var. burnettii JB137-S8]|uniref:Uncharacterized protein n=1 Tax=Agaricus bisporus var. burnettii (strain JB137-S8 / ATCC MYA-4627 / FGSC 10392) TaxID=597362 RepID=K5VTD2_AGABU|nr:uncharacterized protein AGABI1DRAFT_129997 [Agaricus bisporus var. burnettii JB137-S8]EKM77714.1 hypothetical protein AGABI1DRAFT_129997 [Agaricus bisporus var. burnettii JB137-S8]